MDIPDQTTRDNVTEILLNQIQIEEIPYESNHNNDHHGNLNLIESNDIYNDDYGNSINNNDDMPYLNAITVDDETELH